jgi:hypothetical protein
VLLDIANNPEAVKEFAKLPLSAMRPPVVQVGERWVRAGPTLDAVCDLLQIEPPERRQFTPEELYTRLSTILEAAQRYVMAFPPDVLHTLEVPRRKRNVRDLGYHVFMIPYDLFITTEEGAKFRSGSIPIPDEVQTREDIFAAAQMVRERFVTWYASRTPDFWTDDMTTDWGTLPGYEYFLRTTWHAGQHSRQLAWLLESIDIVPPDKLPDSVYEGLPMPERLWE